MRSRTSYRISSQQVHQWILPLIIEALKFKDHGWKCTAANVWSITNTQDGTTHMDLTIKASRRK